MYLKNKNNIYTTDNERILRSFMGVRFNIVRDQHLEDFKAKIKLGTEKIPEENRDDSKIGLALKAFEDSKYHLNSEELR